MATYGFDDLVEPTPAHGGHGQCRSALGRRRRCTGHDDQLLELAAPVMQAYADELGASEVYAKIIAVK